MNWYRNLRISVKLIIGFLIVAVIAGVIGIVGVFSLNTISDNAKNIYEYVTEPIGQVFSVLHLYEENRVETRNLLFLESDKDIKEKVDGIKSRTDEIEVIMSEYQKTIRSDTGRGYYEEFVSAYDAYLPILDEII